MAIPNTDLLSSLDILLVIPPPVSVKMPYIGVGYLDRFLRNNDIRCAVYDMNIELFYKANTQQRQYWDVDCLNKLFLTEVAKRLFAEFKSDINGFVEKIINSNLRVLGFSVNIISLFLANRIAKLIKEKDPKRIIIFGGAATFFPHPRELIEPGFVDIFVIGEGEEVLLGILRDLSHCVPITNKPGILVPGEANGLCLGPYRSKRHLDDFGYPDFKGFQLERYNPESDYKPLPALLTRGCISRCSYCVDYIMWPGLRCRSPRHILDELSFHIENNKTRAFEFNDLACNCNLKQLSELCDLIIQSGLEFQWVSYAIARKGMNDDLLSKMKRAGCHTLIYGVENGSDRILKGMNKIFNTQGAEAVIRLTHQVGICTNINIIVGFPGETEEDFNETVNFLLRNKEYIDEVTNVSGCTLFPGAEIGRLKRKYGVNWEEGTDPMLFCDSNGLDKAGREARVQRLIKYLEEFGLRSSIVNRPEMNPDVKKQLEESERSF